MMRCGVVLTVPLGEPTGSGVAATVGALTGEAFCCGEASVEGVETGAGGLGTK
jgi:hypothetical protein